MEAIRVIGPQQLAEKLRLEMEEDSKAAAAAWDALSPEEQEARLPAVQEEAAKAEQESWSRRLIEELAEKVADLERDLEVLNRFDMNHHVTDGVFFEQEEALDDLRSAVVAWMTPGEFGECYRECEQPPLETNDPHDVAFEARCEVVQAAQFVVDSYGDNNSLNTLANAVVFWRRADDEVSDHEPISPEAGATLAVLRLFNERGRHTMVAFQEAGEKVKAELLEMFRDLDGICRAVGYVQKPAEAVA